MRDKIHDVGDKMNVAHVMNPEWLGVEAKRMAKQLLEKEHRGPGDTIEAAAQRLERRNKVPSSVLLQCWNRPPREMKVSRWMSVFAAYWAEFEAKSERTYEEKRNDTTAHPAMVRLADLIAGRTGEPEKRAEEG